MAYINSANVKFPKADLIIEEDGTGTVTSCYNRTNSTEYVGYYGNLKNATVVINNTTAANRAISYVYNDNGRLMSSGNVNIAAGASATYTMIFRSYLRTNANFTFSIVSGEGTITNNTITIDSEELEVNII